MRDAQWYADQAAEHAAKCTEAENKRRQENGRRTNINHAFAEEEATMFLGGTGIATNESEIQPSAFGSNTFAYA